MKYIYYVIAIVIVFSALAAYGIFDTRIEISKPFLSVNDRIISEDEFQRMLDRKPSYMTQDQFVESVIEKQLLIQEALKMKINAEESFRQSVENFYEQSLIKILVDRKLDSLVVDVTDDEIEKYRNFMAYTVSLTRFSYPTLTDAREKTNESVETLTSDFIDLSDDVKFRVMSLEQGKPSRPHVDNMGVFVYVLEDMKKRLDLQDKDLQETFDIKQVSLFLQNKKKEHLLDQWTDQIRKSAEIWRKK